MQKMLWNKNIIVQHVVHFHEKKSYYSMSINFIKKSHTIACRKFYEKKHHTIVMSQNFMKKKSYYSMS